MQKLVIFLTLASLWPLDNSAAKSNCIHNITKYEPSEILRMILSTNYHKQHAPDTIGATKVELGIYINSFNYISEQSMDYEINIYLREQWRDARLAFNSSFLCPQNEYIKLPDKTWDKIWIPDVFFRNEKHANFHDVTLPNRLMRLYPNGTVYYAAKITTTLACQMDLRKYPLDTQRCPIQFESFGHTMETVSYWWRSDPVEQEKELMMPQFQLKSWEKENCSQTYATGTYPCLQVTFILVRSIGFYIIQMYVPSVLIVILSWVAFWISIDAIPARVTIGLLTVLTMTTQSATASNSLPRVSYIKAMDVWMTVCLIFVFASLLEFAVVNVYSRKEIRQKGLNQLKKDMENICGALSITLGGNIANRMKRSNKLHNSEPYYDDAIDGDGPIMPMTQRKREDMRHRARVIDKLARKLFPFAFVIFNVVYWIGYTLW